MSDDELLARVVNTPAKYVTQDANGAWWLYDTMPYIVEDLALWDSDGWQMFAGRGKIPAGHDWRTTLREVNHMTATAHEDQFSPEPHGITGVKHRIGRELNPTTSSLTDSQAREAALETGTCSDGTQCGTFAGTAYCDGCPNRPQPEYKPDDVAFRQSSHQSSRGEKYDADKPRLDLLIADMPRALEEVAAVLSYGASKYSPGNWQHVENAERRYLAAGMRHELEYAKGEAHDDETNLHHLAHAACCLLFRLELAMREE